MAGLFLIRDDAAAPAALADARAQFARHGFPGGSEHALPGWRLLHFPAIFGGPDSLWGDGDDLVAVAGTLTVDGAMGRPALVALHAMLGTGLPDWRRIGGQFVAVVRAGGVTRALGDFFGAFQLFRSSDGRVLSTSMLATLGALPRVSFDSQGLYEFAFNVTALGNDTVFRELKLLSPAVMLTLDEAGVGEVALDKRLSDTAVDQPLAERVAQHRDRLMQVVAAHVAEYRDDIRCPLSGGLDSRLVVAALRAAGTNPQLYVYGPAGSPDVTIARAIGAADGFDVEWIDKHAAPLAPDAFADHVATSFEQDDALPNYGNIFDNGGNQAALVKRHANGALAASGGAGEVYRDFFYLSGRRRSAREVAATFFGRFVASDATDRFDPHGFLDRLGDKLGHAVGAPDGGRKLSRRTIEQLYPRVRCRALFGREISMEARYGGYLMPFLDHNVVAETLTIPLELKRAGAFESALLTAIDPKLAGHMSAYGHPFTDPPSFAHRFGEWSTRVRPTWVRRQSYGIRRRLGPVGDEHGGLLSPDYMGRVIDLDFPAMRAWFAMDRVQDSGLWRRIACLEYLAQRLGSKLVA